MRKGDENLMDIKNNIEFRINGYQNQNYITKDEIIDIVKKSLGYKNFFKYVHKNNTVIDVNYNEEDRTIRYCSPEISGNIYV